MDKSKEFNPVCKYHMDMARQVAEHGACIRGIKQKQDGRPEELRRIKDRVEQISFEVHTRIDSHIEDCDREFKDMLKGFISRWLFGLAMTILALVLSGVIGMQWKTLDKIAIANERIATLNEQVKETNETISEDSQAARKPDAGDAGGAGTK